MKPSSGIHGVYLSSNSEYVAIPLFKCILIMYTKLWNQHHQKLKKKKKKKKEITEYPVIWLLYSLNRSDIGTMVEVVMGRMVGMVACVEERVTDRQGYTREKV